MLAVPEDQLMLCTSTYGPPRNSLQLTQASALADNTSSTLLQQPSSLQAGSCSHQASNASCHQSAEQRSPSLASVVSELPPNQAAKEIDSNQKAPPNSVCVPPAVLHAPRAIPAAVVDARFGSAPPHVIQLGPIFQPMLAAMQTNPFSLARAPAEALNQALHPAQASRGPVVPTLAANEQLQHMLHAAQAIGYCQGLKRRATQTDKLQKLSFHRRGVMPSSSADQAVHPPGPSQLQADHKSHRQLVVASDAQTAPQPQADAGAPVAQPRPGLRNPEGTFSQGLLAQHHLSVGKLDPHREMGSLESQTLGRSLSGNKRAHEASDAHMHNSSPKRQRLVEVAQQCDPCPKGHDDSKGIMLRCNIADILDAHCGPFSQVSSSARAGSTSVRAGPSRASPTVPSASLAGASCLPAMCAASTLGSASTSSLASLPHQPQDMAGRLALLPQPATAQSVTGAVAAAQGTDWALAAHAAALHSSWQRFLPHVGPQPSIANQLQGPSPAGDQAGVPFHPMLASFPQVVNQLMSQSRDDSMPSWGARLVRDHQTTAPPTAQLGRSGGQRHGQEDDPPYKRLRQGKAACTSICNMLVFVVRGSGQCQGHCLARCILLNADV